MTLDFTQDHNAGIFFIDGPKALIVDGPRGAGKSALIAELFKNWYYSPVKFRSFAQVAEVGHVSASIIRMDYLARFLGQMPFDEQAPVPVFDRLVGTEIVMSRIQNRANEEQFDLLWELDELWSKFAVQVILQCDTETRLQRAAGRKDEGNPDILNELWGGYAWRTRIRTLVLNTTNLSTWETACSTHAFMERCRTEFNMDLQSRTTDDPGVILEAPPR